MNLKINIPSLTLLTKSESGVFVSKLYKENMVVDSSLLSENEVIQYTNTMIDNSGIPYLTIENDKDKNFAIPQEPPTFPNKKVETKNDKSNNK